MKVLFLRLFTISLFLTLTSQVQAQESGHRIEIDIDDFNDTLCYLAQRYGSRTFIVDTLSGIESGEVIIFTGDDALEAGVYILVGHDKTLLFEFIVDTDNQHFKIRTKQASDIQLTFKNSPQNTGFEAYRVASTEFNEKRTKKQGEIRGLKPGSDPHKKASLEVESMITEHEELRSKFIADFAGTLFAYILTASEKPKVPKAPADSGEDWTYRWYKNHYWDNIDFSDGRIANTPVFSRKLEYYFEKMIVQDPDSINLEVNAILETVQAEKLLFKQTFNILYKKYNESRILCVDKVFVNLALNWYTKDLAYWATDDQISSIRRSGEIVAKFACDEEVQIVDFNDENGEPFNLAEPHNGYRVLYFWKENCPECDGFAKSLSQLQIVYGENNLEVLGLYTNYDSAEWLTMIAAADNSFTELIPAEIGDVKDRVQNVYNLKSAPYLILLDTENKIVLKGFNPEQLEYFLKSTYE
ncbi:MAG: thiol-disulfide isomerase/thioredoxin [Flavobacteriaceae bacterium]|jgi:thiol-disulfide isomerase/thioredoxin